MIRKTCPYLVSVIAIKSIIEISTTDIMKKVFAGTQLRNYNYHIYVYVLADWNEFHKKQLTPWHRREVHKDLKLHLDVMTESISHERNTTREKKIIGKDDISFLLPLCGKSLDLVYLYEQGYQVIGCECSELACEQFFSENKIPFVKTQVNEQFDCFQVHLNIYIVFVRVLRKRYYFFRKVYNVTNNDFDLKFIFRLQTISSKFFVEISLKLLQM